MILNLKGAISQTQQGFEKNGPKMNTDISLVEKRHWNVICTCTVSHSDVCIIF